MARMSKAIFFGCFLGFASAAFAQGPAPAFVDQAPTYQKNAKPPANVTLAVLAATVVPSDLALEAQLQAAVSTAVADDPEGQSLGAKKATYRAGCSPTASAFDWRSKGVVSPARDQQTCGGCFVFNAVAALEASWKLQNGSDIDASEQHALDCAGAGDCTQGGFYTRVFRFFKSTGVASEADLQYKNQMTGTCQTAISAPYSAINWAMVDKNGGVASLKSIKDALCVHGPVAAAVYATESFVSYSGGVFNEFDEGEGTSSVNHAILITGWDDAEQAWIIKNSWGTWWGEQGFGRIRYRSNHIGFGAAWVDAAKTVSGPATPSSLTATKEAVQATTSRSISKGISDFRSTIGGSKSIARSVESVEALIREFRM